MPRFPTAFRKERLPSQEQVKWSQLRVGLTVIFASIVLAVLIFLISGTSGIFTSTFRLRCYFDNAAGLKDGAPVQVNGKDVGNVSGLNLDPSHNPTPVEVDLKINSKFQKFIRKDSQAVIATAGVLGSSYIDIDSTRASGAQVVNGDELPIKDRPDLMDMVRSGQSTLQNIQALVQRVDRIVTMIESGQGSIGKFITDPTLYNRLNTTLTEVQGVVSSISAGKGSIGKLVASDEMYNKLNGSVDKLNKVMDDIDSGKGTVGKLMKDETLYRNANETMAKANTLIANINAGKGTLGKLASDEELAKKIDTTIDRLSKIVDQVESGQGTAGKILKDPSLYNNIDQMTVEARELVKAIRENPKKYLVIHLKLF
jgi:phospholipid/cholesterol/gamma-HCH transport system substrate-binding protein